ncbi:AraC family transcriptional regulator [Tahibacter amnicola]|uniref:AraC family transcriptional regulator n=1 Tax=Tahibacter amnicola TaxID=2976241 RepID=A0ABY6BPI8_9GAMM|nr:AraC family transcriptional regulator [Tahibacter amnicola]UXI69687.1 AraC family transcriptional regulator [Tahibacter amnicola]
MTAYTLRETPAIATIYQPALIIDHVRRCEVDTRRILREAGLEPAVLHDAACRISAMQLCRLFEATFAAITGPDEPFLLGQSLLPAHFGAASHAMALAPDLGHALEALCRHASVLSPLLRPRLRMEGALAVLYFTDSHGTGSVHHRLVDLQMSAVVAMARWLGGQRLPWQFCFNRTPPRRCAQYEVHLGPSLRFNCQLDALLIDARWLAVPWPRGNALAAAMAGREAAAQDHAPGVVDALYDHLFEHIRRAPTLDSAAAALGVSPATLKRHLAQSGTHFQAELDRVRTHVSLHLFHTVGMDNSRAAAYLGFHDAANFRRSFKRWTGLTPCSLRASLLPGPA